MSLRRSRLVLVMAASVTLFVSACSAGTSATTPSSASETTVGTIAGSIEGTFDVGGHSLFIKCEGTDSPTIVYLHAAISQPSIDPHLNGLAIQRTLQDDYRVCVYDRRNLGHSQTVDAVQTPGDAMNDMRNLLRAAEVDPPYVLLGASLGGLLSHLYANTYPDEVDGMVLLDSPFPDELSLEHMFPP